MDAFTERLLRRTDSIRNKGNGTSVDRKRIRLQLILDAVVKDALPLVAVELPDYETPNGETEVQNFLNNSFVVTEENTTYAESSVQCVKHEIVGELDEDVYSGYSHLRVGPPGERVKRLEVGDDGNTLGSGSGGSWGSRMSIHFDNAEWGDSRSDDSSSCESSSDAGQGWSGRNAVKQAWAAMMCRGNPQLKMGEQILLAHEVCEVDCNKEEVEKLNCNKVTFNANLHQEMQAETITVAETEDKNEFKCFPDIHNGVKHQHGLEPEDYIEADGGCEENSEGHISQLLKKQKAMLVQVSKVVELCKLSAPGASEERVEGERHLLLANQQYKALLGEVESLKNKRPEPSVTSGELILTDITLPLRSEFVDAIKTESVKFWFVCLAIHQASVVSTTATCELGNNMLYFAGPLYLKGLDENFKILINVYSLRLLNREKFRAKKKFIKIKKCKLFPICPKTKNNKMKKIFLPQTCLTHSSSFTLVGSLELNAANVKHQVWQLTKVTPCSPLSGIVHISVESSLCSMNVTRSSFLSVLEEAANGTCLWHYQWCHLEHFSWCFWNYPSDEDLCKPPLRSVDLRRCVSCIGPAPRELCSRPHAFLVEMCSCQPLPLAANTAHVDERHIFSADSKREMQDWCELLNNIVSTMKLWHSLEDRTFL